jgi:uncharacterized RDD family membrane protein YckC
MFTIIGGDGQEYGPVTAEQVRAWIAAGRANLETKARAVGTMEWRRLGDYVEFGATPPSDLPPPLAPAAPPAPGAASPAAPGAVGLPLAGRGVRTGAALLNALLYFLSMIPGSIYAGLRILKEHPELARGTMLRPDQIDVSSITAAFGLVYAGLGLVILLQCVFIAIYGQNIGKLIAGIRVVNAADGAPAGIARPALVRFVVPVVIIFVLNLLFPLGLVFLVVDYCFIFREDQRCLHDLMAGTKVVKVRPSS